MAGGGIAHTLCAAPQARGGSWGGDTILFSPTVTGGLFEVPATGGTPMPATELNTKTAELNHRLPAFLPDGIHLFSIHKLRVRRAEFFLGNSDLKK